MKTKTSAPQMQTKEVLLWAQRLEKQKGHLVCKRIFDVVVSLLILLVTCPFFLLLAIRELSCRCDFCTEKEYNLKTAK